MNQRPLFWFTIALFGLFLILLTSRAVHAQPPKPRTAFAVVIGNNRSLNGRRPDLHYADDDAAKYYEILQTVAPSRVFLLANFDSDTERLFPKSRGQAVAPTRSALQRIGQQVASEVRAASQRGSETDLYFVFAGHGDVDQGTGFIELADARFTSRDLETWLRAIPFTRAHVIMDSCNSFFMLGARSPGGRYYATSEDAARALAGRLSNVGVFLSTSADGEAFEWSELQSGVFSHIVRSGLLGAADANGDGAVDYQELAAFVATATSEVANPNMRPHVFARGPGGRDDVPIMYTRERTGARSLLLSDARSLRVRLRDRQGVPLLDTHTEAGRSFGLALPASWADGALLESSLGGTRSMKTELHALPEGDSDLNLAMLPISAARGSARGPDDIFQMLFARPFGPRAVSAYIAQQKSGKPPVYGVSREKAERMALLLDQIDRAEHYQRLFAGSIYLGIGAVLGAYGASFLAYHRRLTDYSRSDADLAGGAIIGWGVLSLSYGTYTLLRSWPGERLTTEYRAALSAGDYAHAFALLNDQLPALAAAESRNRWIRGIEGGVAAGLCATWYVVDAIEAKNAPDRLNVRAAISMGALLGLGVMVHAILIESPIERLVNVMQRDPGRLQLEPIVTATPGGAMLGVNGRY